MRSLLDYGRAFEDEFGSGFVDVRIIDILGDMTSLNDLEACIAKN